jgi:hypothetical protein
MHCEGKLRLRSHNKSYCLIVGVTKAGQRSYDSSWTVALGWGLLTDILIATRKKEYGGRCHKICFTTKDHSLQTVAHY